MTEEAGSQLELSIAATSDTDERTGRAPHPYPFRVLRRINSKEFYTGTLRQSLLGNHVLIVRGDFPTSGFQIGEDKAFLTEWNQFLAENPQYTSVIVVNGLQGDIPVELICNPFDIAITLRGDLDQSSASMDLKFKDGNSKKMSGFTPNSTLYAQIGIGQDVGNHKIFLQAHDIRVNPPMGLPLSSRS